jgi:CRISPR-associated protein Cmr1
MYGADGKTPELRPASIKGVMRFWWRAINGDLPLDKLKKQEDEIFGSTEKRSSFSIRVNEDLKSKKEYPLPHKKTYQQSAFKENQTFQVIFRGKNLELISNIFKLSTLLGGFGQRSRRGFGSIRIKEDDTLISIEEIKKLIKSINPKFEYNHRNKSKNEQYPYIKKIQLGRSYSSYNELVKKISTATSGKCGKYLFKDDRLASPIYVSIVKFDKNDFRPIVTTLNSVSEKYIKFNEMLKIQDDFKKAIL